ncbi:hypothetical protein [Saccharibacillus endophyticus]|uniref:Flagellar protein FliT n=1 Tax=Saccharibacillus endophyticus TaxID=2060666 RepID=A0ABQ2AA25_9BACL|nr:hypothetical protein [Saccharibacillus endophyticus]GGH86977.1 hypothetical protein GCM10007362_48020 [Saccharibacillus endophyticus]
MIEESVKDAAEVSVKSLLDQLQFMAESTIERLDEMDEEDFEHFADLRQQLTERIVSARSEITDQEREQISYILKFDQPILQRMQSLKDEAGHWMEQQGKIKVQKGAYQQAYAANSMFFDHRK